MLRWRLVLGTAIIAALAGLCWLDHRAALPGAWLFPVAVALTILTSGEMLGLMAAVGPRPIPWVVHGANLLIVAGTWLPLLGASLVQGLPPGWPIFPPHWWGAQVDWVLLALAAGTFLAFFTEMHRFRHPGQTVANLAGAVLTMIYVGLMMSFLIRLRLGWGVEALVSLVVTAKMGDTGAYTVGRLVGRHKLAPVLSPGKTVEGLFGALLFSTFGAWLSFAWLVPWLARTASNAELVHATDAAAPTWGWLVFGLVIGLVGLLGDLAESLLKRDVGQKDSSRWMPGFGGVLDVLDSLLLTAPVAYVAWACGLVG
ncbi:MAG: phosphatidate cytidylyltransferase [Pirellulales bacterium]|nr:phosphatidate cytidylyltransferase [Pirellulales bacterium]